MEYEILPCLNCTKIEIKNEYCTLKCSSELLQWLLSTGECVYVVY